jgi:hypothetical protein
LARRKSPCRIMLPTRDLAEFSRENNTNK